MSGIQTINIENTETVGTTELTNDNVNAPTVINNPSVNTCKFRLIVSIQSYYIDEDVGRIPYSKLEYTLDSREYSFDDVKKSGISLERINKNPSNTKIIINTIQCMDVSNYPIPTKFNIEWDTNTKTKSK
jgi:hypothetical protein